MSSPNYADLWADVQPDASRRILQAAVDAFAARGYHAATTREIADRAGMSPAGVYVHYRSKADLIYAISVVGSRSSLEAVERAVDGLTAPAERLRAFVAAFVAWHARNHTLARVVQYELGALEPEARKEVDAIRRRWERLLRADLKRGDERGELAVTNLASTTTAILSMGVDVARWYTGRGTSPDKLGAEYGDLAVRMAGGRTA